MSIPVIGICPSCGLNVPLDSHGCLAAARSRPVPTADLEAVAKVSIPNVGNGYCAWCNDDGNLYQVPDGPMICGDCRQAYKLGYRDAVRRHFGGQS